MGKVRLAQGYIRKERERTIIPLLKKNWSILDAACGDGWLTEILSKKGYNCLGVDLNPGLSVNTGKDIGRNLKSFVKADLRELPFQDNSFDCIISFHTLEHVICEYEFKRVLKPGGLLIVEVPVADLSFRILTILKLIQEGVKDHIRIVDFKKLPFKLIYKKRTGFGLSKLGVFFNNK